MRCFTVVVFLVALIFLVVLVFENERGRRLKNWRLYSLCALIYFAWLGMSLYFVSFNQFQLYLWDDHF